MWGLLGTGGKFVGQRLQDEKLKNMIKSAYLIMTALTDDKISDEEFRQFLYEVDKYHQMKAEIRGCQKLGFVRGRKKSSYYGARETKR